MTVFDLQPKACMNHLLLKPTFDDFLFLEGDVVTFNRFHTDGQLQKAFYDEAPEDSYSRWRDVREHFFGIIRGKHSPLHFKIILSLPGDQTSHFLKDHDLPWRPNEVQGLYLNFLYDGSLLKCTTGTSMNTFTLDKRLDHEWDTYVQKMFGRTPEILL